MTLRQAKNFAKIILLILAIALMQLFFSCAIYKGTYSKEAQQYNKTHKSNYR